MSQELQARYLTAFNGSQEELEKNLYDLLHELQASYEVARLNPISERQELEATIASSLEFSMRVHWRPTDVAPILITFDIEMITPVVEPKRLDKVLAEPVALYFPTLTLVYNSLGRERSVKLFPKLLDFESVVRELIVTIMLDYFGPDWWAQIMTDGELSPKKKKAEQSRQEEDDGKLHDFYSMHPLYYLDLKDLRAIMEQADELAKPNIEALLPNPKGLKSGNLQKWKADLSAKLPFAHILENYDQVSIAAKISEIRELRNRVMHGRYLTESNEELIKIICEQYYRFLVKPGHVGDFRNRVLSDR